MDTNALTLASYEAKPQEYIAGSPQLVEGRLKKFIDEAFDELPAGSTVLELGAGFGRDALYLQEKGFSVTATDGADSFVAELRERGLDAQKLNILEDEFPAAKVIYANAVFLHLDREDLPAVVRKARAALLPGGRLIFTLKRGMGEAWSSEKLDAPRHFVYWEHPDVFYLLLAAGFSYVAVDIDDQNASSPWLYAVAS